GRESKDIDIAVSGDAMIIGEALAEALGGTFITMDEQNGVARVALPQRACNLDITSLQGSIEKDLALRDFAIDAFALRLPTNDREWSELHIIDLFGGRQDLESKLVRMIDREAYRRDPVRMVRCVRLGAELDFDIDWETSSTIQHHAHRIKESAPERVTDEMMRIFAAPQTATWLRRMNNFGLLAYVLPELMAEKGVEQPTQHYWDVFGHSVEAVSTMERLLARPKPGDASAHRFVADLWEDFPHVEQVEAHFAGEVASGRRRAAIGKFAALLHDIGKPATKTIDPDGRIRFFGHAQLGAKTVQDIMRRLRFSNREVAMVSRMVEHHLRPGFMAGKAVADGDRLPSDRAIYRYYRDTGEEAFDILFLNMADHWATRGPTVERRLWRWHAELTHYVIQAYYQRQETVRPPGLITGEDVMEAFGLPPGPRVGQLLEAAREAQAGGALRTREEALGFLREHFIGPGDASS
ncbi:MAG: HD domain-containing protein, partial [Chloroflexi bacterium]|nr:HD domain-containing protein [Chloroflexota bacterium]